MKFDTKLWSGILLKCNEEERDLLSELALLVNKDNLRSGKDRACKDYIRPSYIKITKPDIPNRPWDYDPEDEEEKAKAL